ncbi:GDP-mannose 4,6-dehydratase, partial [Streptomyces sp. NPDC006863]
EEPERSFVLHHADLADGVALVNLLRDIQPDEEDVPVLPSDISRRSTPDMGGSSGPAPGMPPPDMRSCIVSSGMSRCPRARRLAGELESAGSSPPP